MNIAAKGSGASQRWAGQVPGVSALRSSWQRSGERKDPLHLLKGVSSLIKRTIPTSL